MWPASTGLARTGSVTGKELDDSRLVLGNWQLSPVIGKEPLLQELVFCPSKELALSLDEPGALFTKHLKFSFTLMFKLK